MTIAGFFHLPVRKRVREKKRVSPDTSLIRTFLALPTEWEISLHPRTPCIRLFGRDDLDSLQEFFGELTEGRHELSPDERFRMETLVKLSQRVQSHLNSTPVAPREARSVIEWLSETIDVDSGETLLLLLATSDTNEFRRGYDAVLRAI